MNPRLHHIPRKLLRWQWKVFLLLIFVFTSVLVASAQKQSKKGSTKGAATPTPTVQPTSSLPPPVNNPGSNTAPPVNSSPANPSGAIPADYIPCVFSLPELLGLRLEPRSAVMTSSDAENLKQRLVSEVMGSNALSPYEKRQFISYLDSELGSFEGLTASAALGRVIEILRRVQNETESTQQLRDAAASGTAKQLIALVELQLEVTPQELKDSKIPEEELEKAIQDSLPKNRQDKTANELFDKSLQGTQEKNPQSPGASGLLALAAKISQLRLTRPYSQLEPVLERLQEAAKGAPDSTASTKETAIQGIAKQVIVDAARTAIAEAFSRPTDVGCAMSILSWNEMRYAFGRLIANEYIGVQVVVRNLNDKQEFALHDAELSVDSDINDRYSRFYSGRDKLIVRGLSLAQSNFTPRNFVVHLAEAVGNVMSATLPVAGDTFKNAAGVYNGGFLPGLKTTWGDHTVDQLNLLSDVGFSSSTNYKTVVPKSGSVMFVMFIPSKQFEEGWWTQKCVEHIIIKTKSKFYALPEFEGGLPVGAIKGHNNVGVDLEAARQQCLRYFRESNHGVVSGLSPGPSTKVTSTESKSEATDKVKDEERIDILPVKPVKFRDWSPVAIDIFRELAWAVVSGTHIQATQNQSIVTQLNCPLDDLGNVQLGSAAGGVLTCEVSGQGLDKVAALRLRNAQNATDTETVDGVVTVSGDATKAKAVYELKKLGALSGAAYKVYMLTTTGVETFANQTLHFDSKPFVQEINPTTADASKQTTPFTLTGFHLDRIAKIHLLEGAGKPPLQYDLEPGVTVTQATFALKVDDDLKKKSNTTEGLKLALALQVKNVAGPPIATDKSIILKPQAAPPPAGSVSVDQKNLAFAPQTLKTRSAAKTVKITNSGEESLTDFSAAIKGKNADAFMATHKCGTIAKGTCPINVTFSPTQAGNLTATLDLSYTIKNGTQRQEVDLSGTGKAAAAPKPSLIPKTLDFGSQAKDTVSGTKLVKVTSGVALNNLSVSIIGAKAKSFSIDKNECNGTLAANKSCNVAIRFTPHDSGPLSATLVVSYGGANTQLNATLKGVSK